MNALHWLTIGVCLLTASSSRADPALLRASLHCEHAAEPGRIVCEFRASAARGKLVWSDALVVHAPGFARPMRSRFTARLGAANQPAASAKFALVASEPGQGTLEVLARGVICGATTGADSCVSAVATVTTLLLVGQQSPPPP